MNNQKGSNHQSNNTRQREYEVRRTSQDLDAREDVLQRQVNELLSDLPTNTFPQGRCEARQNDSTSMLYCDEQRAPVLVSDRSWWNIHSQQSYHAPLRARKYKYPSTSANFDGSSFV
jgi:type II secretory pathway component PulJ